MKIIGKTYQGYICEVGKNEMQSLTNASESYAGNCHAHNIGVDVKVIPLGIHVKAMEHTVTQRKQAADLLRGVANIIETVPAAFTAPADDSAQE